jgi:KTSC domain
MEWIATPESSNLARFGYVANSQTLTVEFKNGGLYNYYDVPANLFEAMKHAASKGQFLASQIKGNYRYARV